MVVSLKGLAVGDSLNLAFTQVVTVSLAYNLSESDVVTAFEGFITKQADFVDLQGALTATLSLACDRCLKSMSVEVSAPISEQFKKLESELEKETVAEGELFSFHGEEVDLTEALEINLLLNIPIKALCMDACKGLCPMCGFNLNEGECACDTTQADPRFEALRSLFQD